MKTVIFSTHAHQRTLLKVTSDVLEQEFKKAVGYQAQRAFYATYYINPSFIKKYADKLDWGLMCRNQPLTNSTIDKYADKLEWEEVSEFQRLSDNMLWKHRHKISWFEASQHQAISENMIRKLFSHVDWEFISGTQKMSIEFMLEMRNFIQLEWLEQNANLEESEIETYKILCKLT